MRSLSTLHSGDAKLMVGEEEKLTDRARVAPERQSLKYSKQYRKLHMQTTGPEFTDVMRSSPPS